MTTAARPGLRLSFGQPIKKMQGSVTPQSVFGPQADDERQRIRKEFEAGVSARQTVLSLCGTTTPFSVEKLASMYADKADYCARFDAATDEAFTRGFLLEADAPEIKALAAELYPD